MARNTRTMIWATTIISVLVIGICMLLEFSASNYKQPIGSLTVMMTIVAIVVGGFLVVFTYFEER